MPIYYEAKKKRRRTVSDASPNVLDSAIKSRVALATAEGGEPLTL